MASVRPFTFSNLKRMTRSEVALEQSILAYFAGRPLAPDFADGLGALLQRYLKEPCKVLPPDSRAVARRDLPAMLPSVACLVVVGAAPSDRKIIVELDMALASFAIERLLGGSGGSDRILRPLTEIEQGVLSFLLLKVLEFFHGGFQSGRELGLSFDRFASRLEDIQTLIDAEAEYVVLGVRLSAGKHVGYARILLPGGLVTEHFGKAIPQGGAGATERAYMSALLETFGDAEVIGRVEMAALPDLTADDLANLESGDIVIIDNHQVQKTAEGLEGSVFIKLGAGKNGGLRCRLANGEQQQRVEILEIVIQEQPQEHAMGEPAAPGAAPPIDNLDNLADTEGLLRDVAAPVVVELGRIRLNAAQVVRLRKGQVLRLPRGPNDPVDLVVNGKVFARGELIEVDGELGVRLLQVAGAG